MSPSDIDRYLTTGNWAFTREPGGTWRLAHDTGERMGTDEFLIQPFDRNRSALRLQEVQEWPKDSVHQGLSPLTLAAPDRSDYLRTLAEALHALRIDSTLEKVVVSRPVLATVSNTSAGDLPAGSILEALDQAHPDAFVFAFAWNGQLWMGATPETLLKQTGAHQWETQSLAGTRQTAELLNDPWREKEREEQGMVTRFIVERLHALGARDIEAAAPSERVAGHLSHLCSRIAFHSVKPALEIARALHPTPAVAGLPQADALDWIRAHEGYDRGCYTGFLGWTGNTQGTHLFVNLRCMQLDNGNALLYVGGGITAQSDPHAEWEETEHKAETLRSVLRMF